MCKEVKNGCCYFIILKKEGASNIDYLITNTDLRQRKEEYTQRTY